MTRAHWTVRLRDAGLPVSQIGEAMANRGGPERLRAIMSGRDEAVSGATFLDPEYRESSADAEVWLRVAEPFTPVAPLDCREVPARDAVVATLVGSYDHMPEVTAALGAHIAAHNPRTGPMFNLYRVTPAQNPDPAAWVTDVCFPIEEA
ncbi:MAG: GyrI-like domain-containing protein [Bifidobacteriaceae bacterium]|nr:GyrI-like domain-containing protein [Bifidobacteriaceae bacterium]